MEHIDFQFRPHRWFRSGHAQTVASIYYPSKLEPYTAIEHRVQLDDGDQLALHDDRPEEWASGERVVISIHGLAGCHRSASVTRLADKLVSRGYRCFRMDQRGCGTGADVAKHHAHAGRSEDVAAVLDYVSEECPGSPISLVGFSMGGNLSLKLAGEFGDQPPSQLDQIIAIAPPIDLQRCSDNIRRGLNRIYDRTFIRKLRKMVYERRSQGWEMQDVDVEKLPGNLFDFDDVFTAPLAGYESARHYYHECSSARVLDLIQVPTVIVTAKDDPLVPYTSFESQSMSDAVQLFGIKGGGHLGFISETGSDDDRWWIDWRLIELIESHPRFTACSQNGSAAGQQLASQQQCV